MPHTHLTVAAVVEKHNRFLFVEEQVRGEHVINQPAGHVETGELPRDAVVREMLEETAWEFEPAAIVGLYLWTQPESHERFLRIVYTGRVLAHDNSRALDDGIIRTLWLSHSELRRREPQWRSPMVIRALDDYLAGVRFPVTMFQQIEVEDLAANAQRVV